MRVFLVQSFTSFRPEDLNEFAQINKHKSQVRYMRFTVTDAKNELRDLQYRSHLLVASSTTLGKMFASGLS